MKFVVGMSERVFKILKGLSRYGIRSNKMTGMLRDIEKEH